MRKINSYITEKLRINKNTKTLTPVEEHESIFWSKAELYLKKMNITEYEVSSNGNELAIAFDNDDDYERAVKTLNPLLENIELRFPDGKNKLLVSRVNNLKFAATIQYKLRIYDEKY